MPVKSFNKLIQPACAGLFAALLSGPAGAESVIGTWLTPPDKKGVVAHIEARPCGDAACGYIARTYDSSGQPVVTPNIGRKVFWDMRPVSGSRWEGRAYVPAHRRSYAGVMQVKGDRVKVRGCLGPVCKSQVWTRIN